MKGGIIMRAVRSNNNNRGSNGQGSRGACGAQDVEMVLVTE